jgi:hypothetical protein
VHWVKALALILVLVVVGWVILSKSSKGPTKAATSTGSTHHSGPTTTTSLPPAPTTTTTLLPAKQVKVQVLNGASVALPLATEWSHKLQTNPGYTTLTPNNATANVSTSAIYVITPGYLPEADQLATAVGLPLTAVDQTIPAPAAAPIPASVRASANLVLVVGPNLQATA